MKPKFAIEELLTYEAIDKIVYLEMDRVVKMLGKPGYAMTEAQRKDDKKIRAAAKLLRSWYSDEGLV